MMFSYSTSVSLFIFICLCLLLYFILIMSLRPQIFHNKDNIPLKAIVEHLLTVIVQIVSLYTKPSLPFLNNCIISLYFVPVLWDCACPHTICWGFYSGSDCWNSVPEKMWQWESTYTMHSNCSQCDCKSGPGNTVLKGTTHIYGIASVNYHSVFQFGKALTIHISSRRAPEFMKNI